MTCPDPTPTPDNMIQLASPAIAVSTHDPYPTREPGCGLVVWYCGHRDCRGKAFLGTEDHAAHVGGDR